MSTSRRRRLRLWTGLAVVALTGAGIAAVTQQASADEVLVGGSTAAGRVAVRSLQPTVPIDVDLDTDLEAMRGFFSQVDLEQRTARFEMEFIHTGGMPLGGGSPLAPTYQVTITAPSSVRFLTCAGSDAQGEGNPCVLTLSQAWRTDGFIAVSGQVGLPEGVRSILLEYEVTSPFPDPDGASGTLSIPVLS